MKWNNFEIKKLSIQNFSQKFAKVIEKKIFKCRLDVSYFVQNFVENSDRLTSLFHYVDTRVSRVLRIAYIVFLYPNNLLTIIILELDCMQSKF